MSELTLFIYMVIAVWTVWLGVRLYGRWINHVTIYGTVWGIQMILFQIKLIDYPDLSFETLAFIFGAWVVFVVSSVTIRNYYSSKSPNVVLEQKGSKILVVTFVLFTIIGAIGTYQHWTVLIRMFGSVRETILHGYLLYTMRIREGIPGEWPYVDSVSLSASFFGGYFAGTKHKFAFLGIIPIITELIEAVAGFGRSKLMIAAILWGTAFFLPKVRRSVRDWKALRKRMVLLFLVIFVFGFGMEFIRTFRGGKESFTGETTTLSQLKGVGFITPSVYMYLSSDVAVLNKFLNHEFAGDGEHGPIGGNTFAPVYNLSAKLGIIEPIPTYERFYAVPLSTNTGTYLRELYVDWGIFGAFVVIYLMGAISSIAFEVFRKKRTLLSLAILSHIYVIVFFTFALQGTRWGYWMISLVFSAVGATLIDKFGRPSTEEERQRLSPTAGQVDEA